MRKKPLVNADARIFERIDWFSIWSYFHPDTTNGPQSRGTVTIALILCVDVIHTMIRLFHSQTTRASQTMRAFWLVRTVFPGEWFNIASEVRKCAEAFKFEFAKSVNMGTPFWACKQTMKKTLQMKLQRCLHEKRCACNKQNIKIDFILLKLIWCLKGSMGINVWVGWRKH